MQDYEHLTQSVGTNMADRSLWVCACGDLLQYSFWPSVKHRDSGSWFWTRIAKAMAPPRKRWLLRESGGCSAKAVVVDVLPATISKCIFADILESNLRGLLMNIPFKIMR